MLPASVALGMGVWAVGRRDLRTMDAGRMDPAGRGLTQAGRVLGILGFTVWVIAMILVFAVLVGVRTRT